MCVCVCVCVCVRERVETRVREKETGRKGEGSVFFNSLVRCSFPTRSAPRSSFFLFLYVLYTLLLFLSNFYRGCTRQDDVSSTERQRRDVASYK